MTKYQTCLLFKTQVHADTLITIVQWKSDLKTSLVFKPWPENQTKSGIWILFNLVLTLDQNIRHLVRYSGHGLAHGYNASGIWMSGNRIPTVQIKLDIFLKNWWIIVLYLFVTFIQKNSSCLMSQINVIFRK